MKISYDDPSAIDPLEFNERPSLVDRHLHFNGNLLFGGVPTEFASISNDPTPAIITGSYIRTTINVDANSGSIPGSPQYYYGDNSPISVNLQPNGNAILFSGDG